MKTAGDILDFWFSKEAEAYWFKSRPEFDARMTQLFEPTASMLAEGPFPNLEWESDANSAVAMIITLDQFPRNMYRGKVKAFSWDAHSLGVAERMVDRGQDMALHPNRRKFVYMPFMHSELLINQNRCVELAGSRLYDEGSTLRHAIAHREVIEQFGRFPHRNKILGRNSSEAEREFLVNGGYDPS